MLVMLSGDKKITYSNMIEKLIRDAFERKDKSPSEELAEKVSEHLSTLLSKSSLPALRNTDRNVVAVSDMLNFSELTGKGVINQNQFSSKKNSQWVVKLMFVITTPTSRNSSNSLP